MVLKWCQTAQNKVKVGNKCKNGRFIPLKRLKIGICGGNFADEITISISGSLSMIFIEVLHKNAEEINGM